MASDSVRVAVFSGLICVHVATAIAVEPSPVEASGVISEALGVDASNWDLPPHNSFTFTEMDRIFPTVLMSPGEGPVAPLTYAEHQIDISAITISDPATGRDMHFDDFLDRRLYNDGLIVIHRGKVVHESYRNKLRPDTRHILMSASKSLTSIVAQIAKQDGHFGEDEFVVEYVPELRDKEAWQDVTIRHVWDMRDGIRFVEDYEDEESDVRRQDRSTGWRPRGRNDLQGLRAFVRGNLNERAHPVGEVFNYASIHTDILAMVVEGATSKPFAEYMEREFWSKIGAEHAAGFGTDGYGHPLAQGTISTTLRDFARVALFVVNRGRTHDGNQLIEEAFFDDLVSGNEMLVKAFRAGRPDDTEEYYRSYFWIIDADDGRFKMSGVHGQVAYFDFSNDFAFVTLGSYPAAEGPLLDQAIHIIGETFLTEMQPVD